MNTYLRCCLWSSFVLVAALPMSGQSIPTPANARAIVETAKSQAKGNNANAAEQTLIQLNLAPPNTAEWHLETAQRLVQLAEQVARDGAPTKAEALARNALQQITHAERLAITSNASAGAKMLAGFIYERFLADSKSALAQYKAAAQAAPQSAAAREASERMQRTDDTFRNKPRSAGK